MLILSRKHGESIVIDGGIRVTVNAIKGYVVKFGIEAPKETPIHRGEIR
jgi:carbon storage regulator